MNDLIGHNQPPNMIGTAVETTAAVSAYLAENPVIQTEEQAREAKVFLDRGKLCVADLEAERDNQVRPLNEQVRQINSRYYGPRELLKRVANELRQRLDRYIKTEEEARRAKAEQAERIAREAELAAREAERLEHDAIGDARLGALDVDVAGLAAARQSAEAAAWKAGRQAALAERETKVKVGGGFTRALGLRSVETLHVANWREAMEDLGLTEHIHEAILKSARAYKKLKGKYPSGIETTIERKT